MGKSGRGCNNAFLFVFFFQYKFYMSFENINSFTRCAHGGKVMFGCMHCDFLYVQIWKESRRLKIYVGMPLQPSLLCTWGKCCSTAKLWKGAIFFSCWLHNSCCKHTKREMETESKTDREGGGGRERKSECMTKKRIMPYKLGSLIYHLSKDFKIL